MGRAPGSVAGQAWPPWPSGTLSSVCWERSWSKAAPGEPPKGSEKACFALTHIKDLFTKITICVGGLSVFSSQAVGFSRLHSIVRGL